MHEYFITDLKHPNDCHHHLIVLPLSIVLGNLYIANGVRNSVHQIFAQAFQLRLLGIVIIIVYLEDILNQAKVHDCAHH